MTFEQRTNTITYAFLEMLNYAEELFGKKITEWTFVGIEFRSDGPHVRYYSEKKISIVLSSNCSNFSPIPLQLFYQLAHETCHLLYPTGKPDANVLNEGISTYFSKIYHERRFPGSTYAIDCIKNSKYYEAFQLVEKLISNDNEVIKKIRQINPMISYVSEEELLNLNLNLSKKEISKLVSKFE